MENNIFAVQLGYGSVLGDSGKVPHEKCCPGLQACGERVFEGSRIIHTIADITGDGSCIVLQVRVSIPRFCLPEDLPVWALKTVLVHRYSITRPHSDGLCWCFPGLHRWIVRRNQLKGDAVRETKVRLWNGSGCCPSVCVHVVQCVYFLGGSGDMLVKLWVNIGHIFMVEINSEYIVSLCPKLALSISAWGGCK